MPVTALLEPSAGAAARTPGGQQGQEIVLAGPLLGHEFVLRSDRALPFRALDRLLATLHEEWDVRGRSSDLGRLSSRPNVMVSVAPVTLLLVRNVLMFVRLARRSGVDPGPCVALLDARHCRVGLDPAATAIAGRLAAATAADVVADFCVGNGAGVGQVRVGEAVRVLGARDPACLHQAVADISRATGSSRSSSA